MSDKPTDPTDKLAADTFAGRRAGYDPNRLATLRQMIHTNPYRTLAGGDGAVLLHALEEMEEYARVAQSVAGDMEEERDEVISKLALLGETDPRCRSCGARLLRHDSILAGRCLACRGDDTT